MRIGVAAEYVTGSTAPFATVSLHVPIFQVPRGGADSRTAAAGLPTWLFLGQQDARIEVGLDATFTTDPIVPGQAHLGGARATVGIPTLVPGDSVDFALTLRDLQLPGATAPTSPTLSIDAVEEVGADVFEFVVGLLRQQLSSLDLSDAALRHVSGLAGILGLSDVDDLPPCPWPICRHAGSPRSWSGWRTWSRMTTPSGLARRAGPARGRHSTPGAPCRRVHHRPGPLPRRPRCRARHRWSSSADAVGGADVVPVGGADVGGRIDVLRADTGTGQVTSVPGLRALATFGELATGGGPCSPALRASAASGWGSVLMRINVRCLR